MLRLLVKLALAAGAVAAVWAWVPVKGRTMAERWERSPSVGAFVDRAVQDLAGVPPASSPARPHSGGAEPRQRGGERPGERPIERHSDGDRRAVDRILAEHLDAGGAAR